MTLLAPAIKAHSALIMNLNDTLIGNILEENLELMNILNNLKRLKYLNQQQAEALVTVISLSI